MEIAASKKFNRFFGVFILFAFLTVAFFGLSQSMGMQMNKDGTMSGCLFNGMNEICTMTFSQHIETWQSMFTATVSQKISAFALLILLAVVFVAAAFLKDRLRLLSSYYTTRWRLYIRQNPHLSLFDHLREAFSQGILNPKIYESVAV